MRAGPQINIKKAFNLHTFLLILLRIPKSNNPHYGCYSCVNYAAMGGTEGYNVRSFNSKSD